MDENNIYNHINKIYHRRGYFDKFGIDVLITILMILMLWVTVTYWELKNNGELIKKNWVNEKCKPNIMPLAASIMCENDKCEDGTSPSTFTARNFTECARSPLEELAASALKPFYLLAAIPARLLSSIEQIQKPIYDFFIYLKTQLTKLFKYFYDMLDKIIKPITNLALYISNIFAKAMGFMVTIMYSFYGFILASVGGLKTLVSMCWVVIGLITATLVPMLFASVLLSPIAATILVIIAAVIVPTMLNMNKGLDILSKNMPGRTACFYKNTKIRLKNNKIKYIKDIKLGDILSNGSVVESTMIIDNKEDRYPFYKILTNDNSLNKYIYVTGSHKIQDPISNRFINVEDSNISIKTNRVNEKLYCINTDDHLIKIGDNIFWDWED